MKRVRSILIYGILIVAIAFAFVNEFGGGISGDNSVEREEKVVALEQETVESVEAQEETTEQTVEEEDAEEKVDDEQKKDDQPAHVNELMAASTVLVSENPVVGIGTGVDFDDVTRTAVVNAGGLEDLIEEGDTVLIKPNLIKLAKPGDGIITDYRMVQILADMAKEAGAARVIIAEASPNGNLYNKYTQYDQLTGVELIDMNKMNEEDCYLLTHDNSPTQTAMHIPKIYMDADVVITAAKLKTHYEAKVTLGLKNAFGVPPTVLVGTLSGKYDLHGRGIANSIVDLNMIRRPDFTVIDGIVGGEGNMPLRGTPVDSQVILAGLDPLATDTVGAYIMGFAVDEVPHLQLAGEYGLGVNDLEKIEVVGANLEDITIEFAPSLSY